MSTALPCTLNLPVARGGCLPTFDNATCAFWWYFEEPLSSAVQQRAVAQRFRDLITPRCPIRARPAGSPLPPSSAAAVVAERVSSILESGRSPAQTCRDVGSLAAVLTDAGVCKHLIERWTTSAYTYPHLLDQGPMAHLLRFLNHVMVESFQDEGSGW